MIMVMIMLAIRTTREGWMLLLFPFFRFFTAQRRMLVGIRLITRIAIITTVAKIIRASMVEILVIGWFVICRLELLFLFCILHYCIRRNRCYSFLHSILFYSIWFGLFYEMMLHMYLDSYIEIILKDEI